MKVFISWSGEQSKALAAALRDFLPTVIQAVRPFMSQHDIEPGERWLQRLTEELRDTQVGIFCLTPENLEKPWLHFEAGAIGKALDGTGRVYTLLHRLADTDVKYPLAQFQARRANKDGIRDIVESLNSALCAGGLSDAQLSRTFEMFWPELEIAIQRIPVNSKGETPARPDRELLEEILTLMRAQQTSASTEPTHPATVDGVRPVARNKMVRRLETIARGLGNPEALTDNCCADYSSHLKRLTSVAGISKSLHSRLRGLALDIQAIPKALDATDRKVRIMRAEVAISELAGSLR